MSRDDHQPTDDATIRPEGEDQPRGDGGVEPDVSAISSETARSAVAGIDEITATLDQLEVQIAEYRRLLAEEDASSHVAAVGEVDDEALGSIAEEIASDASALYSGELAESELPEPEITSTQSAPSVSNEVGLAVADPTIEAVATVDTDLEPEGLETPAVELPELFEELESQLDIGLHETASICVYVDGEELLSYLSSKEGSGVTPDPPPLFRAFSSGKAMAAATIWRLLDSGTLEVDAPVVRYWPEFAQRGKTSVTVRHVLTHTSGLPHDFGRGDVDWGDWGRMVDILASMPLEYEPGEVIHYHAITFGILVAEIASRATGWRFEDLFEAEVASPLRLTNTRFSVEYEDSETRGRIKKLHVPPGYYDPEMPSKMDWLLDNQIVSPGATCITTADDLARLYATVCNGGVSPDDETWLSEAAAAEVYTVHASAYNIEEMTKSKVGQGVWMFDEQPNRMAASEGSRTFGHGGMGTSIAWGDPDHNVAVAIITDKMQDEQVNGRRLNRISAAIRRDLELPVGSVDEF